MVLAVLSVIGMTGVFAQEYSDDDPIITTPDVFVTREMPVTSDKGSDIITVQTDILDDDNLIPSWVKGVFGYWIDDKINDAEVIEAIEFLIDSGIIKIGTSNEIINAETFDCAKQWDKFQENYKHITEVTIVTPEQMQRLTEKLEGSMLELFNNECATTVDEWADRTYDEGSVWMIGEQWKMFAFYEKIMKDENLTFEELKQKLSQIPNTSTPVTIAPTVAESYFKCGAGTVFDVEMNSCVLK